MTETTEAMLERRQMNRYTLPELDYFLSNLPVEPYPYTKTFEEARKDPYVVLHSSGSTGTLKILTLKQGSAAAHDAFQLFPSLGDNPPSVLIDISREPAFLETLPLLHNVSYSGGILPTDAGEVISKRTRLFGGIASTETGILPGEIPPPDMWNYYRYNENPGYELRHYADNMYE
ncbi:hypothetical protein PEX1_053690 [Penicillium expansum]|uniref:AMP-dependent synthetase/ligase n=1 Tax=Penicillium expansum TaxID=27334 RepID=A0A0A2J040_PENEN|nr:hypothetical protein PEX2_031150 [Penicillium expansum]KGO48654.1 hypothetical protein PEXP_073840 [Penicillium expansum]KGO50787.1 hypothetical protein PEX1_053690 [Penicillium expansum]KGO55411.1 hypothetical protein PEX2_031150 [Penicillium expansum]